MPPTIRPGDTTAVLQIDQGQNATLVCAASGIPAPNITWTKSDGGFLPVGYAQYRVSHLAKSFLVFGSRGRTVNKE